MGFFIKPSLYDEKYSYLGFDDWPLWNGFSMPVLDLPCAWHIEAVDYNGERGPVYATFQITDQEGNVHSSDIVELPV